MKTYFFSTTAKSPRNRPSGFGSVIQNYEFADPDPQEIFTDSPSKFNQSVNSFRHFSKIATEIF
jgi:hypothetical protein